MFKSCADSAGRVNGATPHSPQLPPLEEHDDEARREREAIQNEQPRVELPRTADPLAWTEEFALTNNEADRISDPTYLESKLVVLGHVIVFVGKPNAGKSTILFHLA